MTLFLVNPKGKRRRMARKRGRASAAQRRALVKARAAKKRKAAGRKRAGRKAAATRKRSASSRRNPTRRKPARRRKTVATRRRRTARRRNPRRRKRPTITSRTTRRGKTTRVAQSYTRNPPFTLKNMGKILQQGAIDATGVTVGKVGARFVAGFIPAFGEGVMMNLAKQAIAALGVGFLAGQVVPRDYGRFVMAGALSAPVETGLAMIPVVGDLISGNAELGEAMGYGLPMGQADYGLPTGEYVQPEAAPMGEYVEMYP